MLFDLIFITFSYKGQLSIFIEKKTLPDDRKAEITKFITEYKMLELGTYVDSDKQVIINKLYLTQSGGNNRYSKKYFINYL